MGGGGIEQENSLAIKLFQIRRTGLTREDIKREGILFQDVAYREMALAPSCRSFILFRKYNCRAEGDPPGIAFLSVS